MALKLYYYPQTRAARVRWLLEEIGTAYELVRIDLVAREQKQPTYLRINPTGTVPTLIDDDLVLFESAAIVQHLADKFPEQQLAPPIGTAARAKYYQWIHYAMSACGGTPARHARGDVVARVLARHRRGE